MASEKTRDGAAPKDAERRALLKAATVAGGAVAASALLPGDWKRPVATIGGLPAHAQTSGAITLVALSARATPSTAPDMARQPSIWSVTASCSYSDSYNDFSNSHQVTVIVTNPATDVPSVARPAATCGTENTYVLSGLVTTIIGNPTSGTVEFTVVSACAPPGHIKWRIHTATHGSNWVEKDVILPG